MTKFGSDDANIVMDRAVNPDVEPPPEVVEAMDGTLEEWLTGLHTEDRIAAASLETDDERHRKVEILRAVADKLGLGPELAEWEALESRRQQRVADTLAEFGLAPEPDEEKEG
jgi:hypothetical protein